MHVKNIQIISSIQLRFEVLVLFFLIGGFQNFEVNALDDSSQDRPLLGVSSSHRGAGTGHSINIAPQYGTGDGERDSIEAAVVVRQEPPRVVASEEGHSADDDVVVDPALLVPVDTREAEGALDKLGNLVYYHLGGDTRREIEAELPHVTRVDVHLLTEAAAVIESGQFNTFFGKVIGQIRQLQKITGQLQAQSTRLRCENQAMVRSWERAVRRPNTNTGRLSTIESLESETMALTTEIASVKATNTGLKWGLGSTVVTAVVGAVVAVVIWIYKK